MPKTAPLSFSPHPVRPGFPVFASVNLTILLNFNSTSIVTSVCRSGHSFIQPRPSSFVLGLHRHFVLQHPTTRDPWANINESVAREIRFVRLATVMATAASSRQTPATWNWSATTSKTTTTTTTTTRSRHHLLVLFTLLIIPSFLSAGTASAQCGADFGFPTEKLRVFSQDTINVTYTSTFDNPSLACWCGTSTDKEKSEYSTFPHQLSSRRFTHNVTAPPSPASPRYPSRCPAALWVTGRSSTKIESSVLPVP